MTPAHSGIHFGRIAQPAFRRRLAAVTLAAAAALGIAMLVIAPVSSPACHSLARATRAPDLRVTALPGVELDPVLALPGLSAASGPYPGVGTSVQAGGAEISTWIEGRPGRTSAVDRPFLVRGSWTRRNGMVVEQGLARRLGFGTAWKPAGTALPGTAGRDRTQLRRSLHAAIGRPLPPRRAE